MEITKDMVIGDLLKVDKAIAPILMASGMHCVGCIAASGETLAEACAVHGLNPEEITKRINDFLAK